MHKRIGKKCWAIPEGYIPPYSHSSNRALESHETICVLNASNEEATISITIFFSDKDPVGPYIERISPRRTKHIRFNDLNNPAPIPRGVDFSSIIESNVEVVVQHSRLDSRQSEDALMTTIAFPCD